MKKQILIILIMSLAISQLIPAITQAQSIPLKKGMESQEIQAIQKILKQDSSIYPEGYTTGYFGLLTEEAVKKLQKKFGVPETGIIDEQTEIIIFPYFDIRITSPNGNENWETDETRTIRWQVLKRLITDSGEEKIFWPRVSVDLYKREATWPYPQTNEEPSEEIMIYRSIFVKHLGFADLFNGYFNWKISSDIPSGHNYVIRISMGRKILPCILPLDLEGQAGCLEKALPETSTETKLMPPYYPLTWDESDMPFTISRETPPCPDIKEAIAALEKIIAEFTRMRKELEKIVDMLKAIPTY